jgi:hypothetical protein
MLKSIGNIGKPKVFSIFFEKKIAAKIKKTRKKQINYNSISLLYVLGIILIKQS